MVAGDIRGLVGGIEHNVAESAADGDRRGHLVVGRAGIDPGLRGVGLAVGHHPGEVAVHRIGVADA